MRSDGNSAAPPFPPVSARLVHARRILAYTRVLPRCRSPCARLELLPSLPTAKRQRRPEHRLSALH